MTQPIFLLIDGGTTHTRFALVREGGIIERNRVKVGASDGGEAVRKAVRESVQAFEQRHKISAAVASGMITSAGGVKEIPHIVAPSTFEDLIKNTHPHLIDSVSADIPFYLVPGIKTLSAAGNLAETDVMRGEETEVFAALEPDDEGRSILFIHAGSHIKGILYQNKAITGSVTTLSGELLWAVGWHTILKGDLTGHQAQGPGQDIRLNECLVQEGFLACRKEGFTRSLFMIRLMGLQSKLTEQKLSFLYGVLACSDLQAFEPMLEANVDKLVLYGREPYTNAMRICLEAFCGLHAGLSVVGMGYQESEDLSINALLRIAKKVYGK